MKPGARDEVGMALALAIVVLVVVGVLIAAVFFIGTQEQRVAENARDLQQAFGVVEQGGLEVIRSWDPAAYNARQVYPFDSAPTPVGYPGSWTPAPHRTGAYGGYIYKLNGELYLIDITGRASRGLRTGAAGAAVLQRGGMARQRIGLLAHVRPVQMDILAPLTTGRTDRLSGQVTIDGNDRVPPGWAPCGPPDSAKAGIRVDSSPADRTFDRFGEVRYTQLVALARSTLPGGSFGDRIGPVVVDGRCDETVATNWGDPMGPNRSCNDYFPIVHVGGDAVMSGVQGQGILLVDGSLALRGGFQWFGIVLVRGSLMVVPAPATDVHIWGAVRVRDSVMAGADPATGSVAIDYSKCPIAKALDVMAVAATLRSRGWIQLF